MNGNEEVVHEVEILDPGTAMTASESAALDTQIRTAKAYPRSVTKARQEALTLATMDENVAGSCFYSLPRAGKAIEGPSARLAEIIAHSWGNIRVQGEITAQDARFVTATATCLDLEKNTGYRVQVQRRITDSAGKTYKPDMIGVTANAAISIALRNAVFKVVPRALWESIYEEARKASLGQAGTTVQKRENALGWFKKAGLNEEQLCAIIGVKGLEDIGIEQLITLRGLRTALTDGETTIEQLISRQHEQSDAARELTEAVRAEAKEGKRDRKTGSV